MKIESSIKIEYRSADNTRFAILGEHGELLAVVVGNLEYLDESIAEIPFDPTAAYYHGVREG